MLSNEDLEAIAEYLEYFQEMFDDQEDQDDYQELQRLRDKIKAELMIENSGHTEPEEKCEVCNEKVS